MISNPKTVLKFVGTDKAFKKIIPPSCVSAYADESSSGSMWMVNVLVYLVRLFVSPVNSKQKKNWFCDCL